MNHLKEKIIDEKNGISYHLTGDYYIPDIEVEPVEEKPLGKYGRMRRAYLMENNTLLYNHLVLNGKLFPHLQEIQSTASERLDILMKQLLLEHPAPDKRTQQLAWAQHMNTYHAIAEEMIVNELICC